MKHELQGLPRSGRSTHTEEWHDPEPTADDDPALAGGPVTPSGVLRGMYAPESAQEPAQAVMEGESTGRSDA